MYSYIQVKEILKGIGEILGFEVVVNQEIDDDMFDLIWIKGDQKISFRLGVGYDRIKDAKFVGSVIKAVELGYEHIHIAPNIEQVQAIEGYKSLCKVIDVSDVSVDHRELFSKVMPEKKFIRSKVLITRLMKRSGKSRSKVFKLIKQALSKGMIEKQRLGGYQEIYYRLKEK